MPRAPSLLHLIMRQLLTDADIIFVEEYKFHKTRLWCFDFAIPAGKIAVECEGGVFTGGRHTRGMGFIRDIQKYNLATSEGWRVFRAVGVKGGAGICDCVVVADLVVKAVRGQ